MGRNPVSMSYYKYPVPDGIPLYTHQMSLRKLPCEYCGRRASSERISCDGCGAQRPTVSDRTITYIDVGNMSSPTVEALSTLFGRTISSGPK